jgi:hypothetical protein
MFTALIMVCNLQGDCAVRTDGIPYPTRPHCEAAIEVYREIAAINNITVLADKCVAWGTGA